MDSTKDYNYTFKILLIGNTNAGKSSLLLKLSNSTTNDAFVPAIGINFKARTIVIGGKKVRLQIWDTNSQEKFKIVTGSYYKGAHGIMAVYSVDNRKSFSDMNTWLADIDKHTNEGATKMLIGNKCDLESQRQVSYDEGKAYADDVGIEFIETSTKDEINIESALYTIAKELKAKADMKAEKEPENGNGRDNNANLRLKPSVKRNKRGIPDCALC